MRSLFKLSNLGESKREQDYEFTLRGELIKLQDNSAYVATISVPFSRPS